MTNINIDSILTAILKREGWPTVSNRPADKGGLTKGGIVFKYYEPWLRRAKGRTITPTDFIRITEDDAREFLLDNIAGPIMAVSLVDTDLFALMFDWATTSYVDDPTMALQRALRQTSSAGDPDLAVDGRYGPRTDAALRRAKSSGDVAGVVRAVARDRVRFYVTVALHDPAVRNFRNEHPTTDLENVKGWVNRALEFL